MRLPASQSRIQTVSRDVQRFLNARDRFAVDLIDALQRELSFALVTATHDAGVAARAGRVVELADGRVVGVTSP